jgi:pimeloyl-ACP methyl ester carboxylesterase
MDALGFGIVVSCPGSTLLESDLNYWKYRNQEVIGSQIKEATDFQKKVFEHIAGKITKAELDELIALESSNPWFEFIWIPNLETVQTDSKLLFNPIPHFQSVQQPILVIQGDSDKVIPTSSHITISNALVEAQNEHFEVEFLEGASHSMHYVKESDFPYWARVHTEYFERVERWLIVIH